MFTGVATEIYTSFFLHLIPAFYLNFAFKHMVKMSIY